ncbi:MAG: cation transporter [Candidatus Planktophila sp.]
MKFGLRNVVALVAVLNLAYFCVEFSFAQIYGSLALLSDSLDFLEDAAVNLLILVAFTWSILARRRLSYLLAFILLIPGVVFIFEAVSRFNEPQIPNGFGMSVIGLGALVVNLYCAFILARHKTDEGGLAKAAYLSARNDAVANVLIISAGVVTAYWASQIPDLVIGLIIFSMNFDAARQVLKSQE